MCLKKVLGKKNYWQLAFWFAMIAGGYGLGIMMNILPAGNPVHPNAAFLFTIAAIAFAFSIATRK